ncbi:MAG: type II toxin-antitoxin system RelE/ParE family toxin [Thermoplasmata archaeon]
MPRDYAVLVSKKAQRQLRRIPRPLAERVREKLSLLEENPLEPRPGADISLVWGHDDPPLYRLRVGEYRVLYFVLKTEVRVTEILHRSKAYRGLD